VASLVVSEKTLSSSNVTDLADTGTESANRSERVALDDDDDDEEDMEIAEILIFRPYYKYWEKRIQRRSKQTK
jgi:hypothetical protein